MPDITALVPRKTVQPSPQRMPARGVVTTAPASLTAPTLQAVVPAHTTDYAHNVTWTRQGATLPAVGADCLIVWDDAGAGTVVWFAATVEATVHGTITSAGAILRGTGFTASKTATGRYAITYATAYASTPDVTLGWGDISGGGGAQITAESAAGFSVVTYDTAGSVRDNSVTFHAIGT